MYVLALCVQMMTCRSAPPDANFLPGRAEEHNKKKKMKNDNNKPNNNNVDNDNHDENTNQSNSYNNMLIMIIVIAFAARGLTGPDRGVRCEGR